MGDMWRLGYKQGQHLNDQEWASMMGAREPLSSKGIAWHQNDPTAILLLINR
jgi:hypothetical protein